MPGPEQLATLDVMANELITAPDMGDLIEAAGRENLDAWQKANLAEMKRNCAWYGGAVRSGGENVAGGDQLRSRMARGAGR